MLWSHVTCPDGRFSLELVEETVEKIRRQTVPGRWTRDGETARPIAGQASPLLLMVICAPRPSKIVQCFEFFCFSKSDDFFNVSKNDFYIFLAELSGFWSI